MDDATLDEALVRDRVIVFFAPSRSRVARHVETASAESSVPFVRVDRARAPAKLAYYEHGERLESESVRNASEVDAFIERIESLQEDWRIIRGRLRVDQFG